MIHDHGIGSLFHRVNRTDFHTLAALHAFGRIDHRLLVNNADRIVDTYRRALGAAVTALVVNLKVCALGRHDAE
jgi:hypothetical protein